MGADDLWTRWRERPLTVRALLVVYALSVSLALFDAPSLVAATIAMALGALFLWGFWVANRAVFLLAFIAEGTLLVVGLGRDPRSWGRSRVLWPRSCSCSRRRRTNG